jgi:hypothetical protein
VTCTHRYILTPQKAEARGICKRCGHKRNFSGGIDDTAAGAKDRLTWDSWEYRKGTAE